MGLFATSFPFVTKVALQVMILLKIGGCDHRLDTGRYSLPRDAPPAHVARDALLDDERHTTIRILGGKWPI